MSVAKKKNYGSINLLKGIQGSKLAALITVLVILFAIPITVNVSRQQQQTKQEASTAYPCGRCSSDTAHKGCWAAWMESDSDCDRAIGDTYTNPTYACGDPRCSAGASTPTKAPTGNVGIGGSLGGGITTDAGCKNAGGSCMSLTNCGHAYKTGLCPGGSSIICCLYSGVNQCAAAPYYGKCQYTDTACAGRYISGKCPGPSNYKCCTRY
jgi:hypothetical protein